MPTHHPAERNPWQGCLLAAMHICCMWLCWSQSLQFFDNWTTVSVPFAASPHFQSICARVFTPALLASHPPSANWFPSWTRAPKIHSSGTRGPTSASAYQLRTPKNHPGSKPSECQLLKTHATHGRASCKLSWSHFWAPHEYFASPCPHFHSTQTWPVTWM